MNSLFSSFFTECWTGILGGVRDYLGELLGGCSWKQKGNKRQNEENYTGNNPENITNPIE